MLLPQVLTRKWPRTMLRWLMPWRTIGRSSIAAIRKSGSISLKSVALQVASRMHIGAKKHLGSQMKSLENPPTSCMASLKKLCRVHSTRMVSRGHLPQRSRKSLASSTGLRAARTCGAPSMMMMRIWLTRQSCWKKCNTYWTWTWAVMVHSRCTSGIRSLVTV